MRKLEARVTARPEVLVFTVLLPVVDFLAGR
jgi:hypothetical protein